MDAGDHRVLVPHAAIGLRHVEGNLFRFRRPGNNAAGIVALGAESPPANRQNQRGHKKWALSHVAPQPLKITSRVDVKVLPRGPPALVQTVYWQWHDVIQRDRSRRIIN